MKKSDEAVHKLLRWHSKGGLMNRSSMKKNCLEQYGVMLNVLLEGV